ENDVASAARVHCFCPAPAGFRHRRRPVGRLHGAGRPCRTAGKEGRREGWRDFPRCHLGGGRADRERGLPGPAFRLAEIHRAAGGHPAFGHRDSAAGDQGHRRAVPAGCP
ncbi:Uncharacterized protein APZ42_002891, partial [Daphnia magna]